MRVDKYQELAMRTNDEKGNVRILEKMAQSKMTGGQYDIGGLLNGCLGLAGESGEALDMVKKWIFHEKELDPVHMKKELGDVMWYIAMICDSMDFSLDEILDMNIEKLEKGYPEGFDTERANNRNPDDV